MDEPFKTLVDALSAPADERSRRFRQLAAEALDRASVCEDKEARAGLINLASKWHDLALEMERTSGN